MDYTRASIVNAFDVFNVLLIDFVKADGTERSMVCTRNFDIIPKDDHPKSSNKDKPVNEEVVVVYDLEVKGWRSFRVDSVINVVFDYSLVEEYDH